MSESWKEYQGSEAAVDLSKLTQDASAHFFEQMQRRHEMGQEKYGAIKFMEVNTLEEAMEEVVDLANYALYTFMKLYVLNAQLSQILPKEGHEPLGTQSFMSNSGDQ